MNVWNALTKFFGGIRKVVYKKLFIVAKLSNLKTFKIESIMSDSLAKQLLYAYLEGDSLYMSEAMKYFKCYDICNTILVDLSLLNNKKFEGELMRFCPPQEWELNLKKKIEFYQETKSEFSLSLTLSYLRGQSRHKLELCREYMLFYSELQQGSSKIRGLFSDICGKNFLF